MPHEGFLGCYSLLKCFLIVQIERHIRRNIRHQGIKSTRFECVNDASIFVPFVVKFLSIRTHRHGTEYKGVSPLLDFSASRTQIAREATETTVTRVRLYIYWPISWAYTPFGQQIGRGS